MPGDDLLTLVSDDEDSSPKRRFRKNREEIQFRKSNSKQRSYSHSHSPTLAKKSYSTPEAKKRRSEKFSTNSIMLEWSSNSSKMDLKFDESITEEIPAGSGFYVDEKVEEDDSFDDLDTEYLSAKKRLSFIGRFIEGKRKFEHPRIITGNDGALYTPFFTKRFVFSNHFPCKFIAHGRKFNCSEQYYMYEKARFFGDRDTAEAIMNTVDPKDMKLLGKEIIDFDQDKWDSVSLQVMKSACYFKFTQDVELRQLLFETAGTTLIEANKIDRLWGAGVDLYDPDIKDQTKWPGRNQLGFLLTELRNYLMKQDEYKQEIKKLTL